MPISAPAPTSFSSDPKQTLAQHEQSMSVSARAIALKIAYLQTAAQSLAVSSPSTASYLAGESGQLKRIIAVTGSALTDRERQIFCTACGNVFVPAWNCSLSREERAASPKISKSVSRRPIVYHCRACQHNTSFGLPSPPVRSKHKKQETSKYSLNKSSQIDARQQPGLGSATPSSRRGSKKRAKAREKRSGLKSLLETSRDVLDTSSQLNLADLMNP